MEGNFGFLALIPAAIVIFLALKTKKTMLSLIVGSFIGVVMINNWNVFKAVPSLFNDFIIPNLLSKGNVKTIIIITVVNGLARLLKITGAGQSLAYALRNKIKSRKSAETITCASGFAFIYTEPNFVLGVIMRPVTEAYRVAKVKLAYITDSLGASMASMSPIASYGPYYVGLIAVQLEALNLSTDPWSVYFKYLPFNFYAIIAVLLAWYSSATGKEIGKMYIAEKRALETGRLMGPDDVPIVNEVEEEGITDPSKLRISNFFIPMGSLLVSLFATIFYTGNIVENGFPEVFYNSDVGLSIIVGMTVGGLAALFVGVRNKVFSGSDGFEKWIEGMYSSISVNMIIVFAWVLSTVSDTMGLKAFIANVVEKSGVSPALIPAVVFLAGCIISFATGSSWGTTALLMPIAVPISYEIGIPIEVAVAACIAGGIFGDHCSPISDTTIKASMAAGCDHMQHVQTQLPYALIAGLSAFITFVLNGFISSPIVSLAIALVIAFVLFNIAHKKTEGKYGNYDFSSELNVISK